MLLELAAGNEDESAFQDSTQFDQIPARDYHTDQEHLKAREVVTYFPSLFSYTLDDRSGVNGPVAVRETWKASMENNFKRLHATEGLFLFAFEPETMGLTQQRARILEEFGRYVRTQNTWIATLGEMTEWWIDRHHTRVEIASIDVDGYTLIVHNDSEEVLRGLSLDFSMGMASHKLLELDDGDLDVWSKRDPDNMLLVIEALPPGSHQLRLVDPSITASISEGE